MTVSCSFSQTDSIIAPLDATIDRFRTLLAERFDWCKHFMGHNSARLRSSWRDTTALIREVCTISGSATIIDDARVSLAGAGVLDAVRSHDDNVLIEWLMEVLSYQGVSDAIADGYMEQHGRIKTADIAHGLNRKPGCQKLNSYWQFHDCGYRKTDRSCREPRLFRRCPLPRHNLRNGRLNQTAYSLFLFCRDVAEGDLVAWIDRRLAEADISAAGRNCRLAAAIIDPLTHIYGVSHKVLTMSISELLLAGDPDRERWQTAGGAMIAVDTLVHNWLHRTGILKKLDASHLYGPHCYAPNGCAEIIRLASRRIDARRFNLEFPRNFPRFVQHAIWQFCSQSGFDQCNGNRINDRDRCDLKDCALYRRCRRVVLHRPRAQIPPS